MFSVSLLYIHIFCSFPFVSLNHREPGYNSCLKDFGRSSIWTILGWASVGQEMWSHFPVGFFFSVSHSVYFTLYLDFWMLLFVDSESLLFFISLWRTRMVCFGRQSLPLGSDHKFCCLPWVEVKNMVLLGQLSKPLPHGFQSAQLFIVTLAKLVNC